ncbi:1,2-phenylacetyl-CoA epoxidase subunit PaaC [Streptomyces sp. NPDC058614]|uniref:1,2-phenylacetyl-CoA epoxidase subunit PaaC n=1 Tax=Streptomyces sp. NPDC058614 TaxID=3346557 RepID=UPI00364D4A9C
MSDDHVYLSLAEGHDDSDARWAFGTGFEDPLHGVDQTVPDGIDAGELAAYCLALGDDALVSAQRLAQWCTRAPELEEEVALANIGLDLLGQARLLYARAGQVDGTGRGEDAYAYFRDADDFRNVRLAELPGGDFAFTVTRLLVLSSWRLAVFERLAVSTPDPVLAAIAAKGVKELTYHRQYAAEWAVRLGDGTEESRRRMRDALAGVAPYADELFTGAAEVRDEVLAVLRQVTDAAGLVLPEAAPVPGHGREGDHTEHLAPLLAELQSVARAHPEATW